MICEAMFDLSPKIYYAKFEGVNPEMQADFDRGLQLRPHPDLADRIQDQL